MKSRARSFRSGPAKSSSPRKLSFREARLLRGRNPHDVHVVSRAVLPVARVDDELPVAADPSIDLVAVHDALTALEAVDERKSRVIELRFFGGLSVKETAEVLDISSETVMRDWKLAKAWLSRQMRP